MGWSWALFLCHSVLSAATRRTAARFMRCSVEQVSAFVVRDRCPAPRLEDGVVLAPSVDNANALCYNVDHASEFLYLLKLEFQALELAVHDMAEPTTEFGIIGMVFDVPLRRRRHLPAH